MVELGALSKDSPTLLPSPTKPVNADTAME